MGGAGRCRRRVFYTRTPNTNSVANASTRRDSDAISNCDSSTRLHAGPRISDSPEWHKSGRQ